MKEQQRNDKFYTESHRRLRTAFEEQQKQSKNFQMLNFYSNNKLDIQQLKNMLQKAKNNRVKTLPLQDQKGQIWQSYNNDKIEIDKVQQNDKVQIYKVQRDEQKHIVFNQSRFNQHTQASFQKRYNDLDKDSEAQNLLQIMMIKNKQKGQKTSNDPSAQQTIRQHQPREFIRNRANSNNMKQKDESSEFALKRKNVVGSKYPNKHKVLLGVRYKVPQVCNKNLNNTNNSNNSRFKRFISQRNDSKLQLSCFQRGWDEFGIEQKLIIGTKQQLLGYQQRILKLWRHYELLSQILQIIHGDLRQQKRKIGQYIENVCSEMFEFIKDVVESLFIVVYSKKQNLFLQRLRKNILMTRVYEHLCIMFLSLEICLQKKRVSSYLINFIGYSSSNIIFIIRLMSLIYRFQHQFTLKDSILNIFNVIDMFQFNSYGAVVTRIGQIITRVEHNNRVINIFDKTFQKTIQKFTKVTIFNQPISAYSKQIYQFLASQLVKNGIVGIFQAVEMAPAPYLKLQKLKTIVIEPWLVLFYLKNGRFFLRPYADTFLFEIKKHCNIVYWTDLLPQQIDPLLQKLPAGSILYKYHCKYQKETFIKILDRIGTNVDNTLIIDREAMNYHYNRQNGIQLPWKGQIRDNKLFNLICLMKNILQDQKSLVSSLSNLRYQMSFASHGAKSKIMKQVPFKTSTSNDETSNSIYPRALSKQSYNK